MVKILLFAVLSFVVFCNFAMAQEAEFVGVKKCKMCHNKESLGKQYELWTKEKHSQAYKVLGTPKAKELATKMGVKENPQESGKCLKCHVTAYNFTEKRVSTKITLEEGISCESCHGAGSLYSKEDIMKKFQAACSKGLNVNPKEVCKKCHNPESPTYKEFNYDKFFKEIAHPIPQK
ncbi:MAG: cytochrome C554 [Candidatus Brocadiae bacterium]|nr:cytochrome C554 [Candidatus Brocadiia bacterium]